jgi:predicted heme/steroid binding protein
LDGLSLTVLAFVALISLPFLGLGLYEAYENQKRINAFISTNGTVIDNSYATINQDGTASGAYYPVVEFRQETANVVRFTDGVGSLPPDYAAGTRVAVMYNP